MNNRQHAQVQILAEAMKPLAPGWNITIEEDYDHAIRVQLSVGYVQGSGSTSGASLRLSVGPYNHPGRVVVSGSYPPDTWGRNSVGSITIALSRGAEAIVKDIKHRFLPGYLESYAKALAAKQAADECQAQQEAIIAELAAILGVEPRGEVAYAYGAGRTRATVKNPYQGGVSLELTVPVELARQLLVLVAAEASQEAKAG